MGVVPRPAAGSVHASRNPPRAPAASLRDRLRRALTEVDPIWLAQSNDPAAVALRQARQDGKRPAAWRVLHRVTYVSRVLASADTTQQPLEQALATLNISSNCELIRTLEPFARGRTGQYADFAAAVRNAVTTYLPTCSRTSTTSWPSWSCTTGSATRHNSPTASCPPSAGPCGLAAVRQRAVFFRTRSSEIRTRRVLAPAAAAFSAP